MLIRIRRGWEIPERLAAPEDVYLSRRTFLKNLGLTGLGAIVDARPQLALNPS